jgi:hypothetical protein
LGRWAGRRLPNWAAARARGAVGPSAAIVGCRAQDAGDKARQMLAGSSAPIVQMQIVDGKFRDNRWENGRWVLTRFAGANGEVDWDAVRTHAGGCGTCRRRPPAAGLQHAMHGASG